MCCLGHLIDIRFVSNRGQESEKSLNFYDKHDKTEDEEQCYDLDFLKNTSFQGTKDTIYCVCK